MASLSVGQRMILAALGGFFISTAGLQELAGYTLLTCILLLTQNSKLKILKASAKAALFFIVIYSVGGMLTGESVLQGGITGIITSLPIVVSLIFIITAGYGITPGQIESSIRELLSPLGGVPAKEIAFMIGLSYRFIQEAAAVWKTHTEIMKIRRRKGISPLRYSTALLYSPLMNLLMRADQLTEAYILRNSPEIDDLVTQKPRRTGFYTILAFLFAIKIVTIYTT